MNMVLGRSMAIQTWQNYQTAILQVQKSEDQTTQNIKSAKVKNQNLILQVLLTFAIFAPAIFGFQHIALLIFWVVWPLDFRTCNIAVW